MKKIRILALSILLCSYGLLDAQAQVSFSEEELKAFQEQVKQNAAKKDSSGGSRRRDSGGGAAAGGGGNDLEALEARWQSMVRGEYKVDKSKNKGPKTWEEFARMQGAGVTKTVDTAIQQIIKKQITVIAGQRVTDAVTGELLDDAREIRVDEDKKDEYYDDGTHGDLVAGDGQYTRIEEITGVIGPNNQRIKEQLIQALYQASRLDAREFYGHTLMSTDHSTRPERNVRWALVEAPADQVGFRISEVATEKTVEVPDFWAEEASRDVKIAGPNGWARSFLDEYRVEKGGLTSEFYTPYVPHPPTIPKIPPPSAEGWTPFAEAYDPDAEGGAVIQGARGKAGKGSKELDPAAAKWQQAVTGFVNRGAGKGSTSGGYFSGGN